MTARDSYFFEILDDLGVSVEYTDLEPLDIDGEYDHELKRIWLQENMAPRLHTWKLAHETAHAVFGDVPSMFGPANAKMERRADEWAALQLIQLDAYRECEALREGHVASMAHDLGVVSDAVEAFQKVLLRVDCAVYMSPRLGHGQYAVRFEVA